MSAVFLKLLNLSITASWLILAVILVRFLLRKAPKWISCVLWALVAIRCFCMVMILETVPNVTDKKFKGNPTKSYRTKHPLKIVAEAINWTGHSPEVLQAMLDNLKKIEDAGIKPIE